MAYTQAGSFLCLQRIDPLESSYDHLGSFDFVNWIYSVLLSSHTIIRDEKARLRSKGLASLLY